MMRVEKVIFRMIPYHSNMGTQDFRDPFGILIHMDFSLSTQYPDIFH